MGRYQREGSTRGDRPSCLLAIGTVVSCDMSAADRSAVIKSLPKADLMFNCLHLAKLVSGMPYELRGALVCEPHAPRQKAAKARAACCKGPRTNSSKRS